MAGALVLYDAAAVMAAELRLAWASGRRVAVSLDDGSRLEGHVQRITATSTWLRIRGLHVPLERVLAVHSPSRLGDSTARGGAFHGVGRREVPQLEALWAGGP